MSHLLLLCLSLPATFAPQVSADRLTWDELPSLPDTPGFGGPLVGTHGGALLVAGGANFPDAPPWEGGSKVWYDDVYVLESADSSWIRAGVLETPLAYASTISTPEGVAILGGCDQSQRFAECWMLAWNSEAKQLTRSSLPALPTPSAFCAVAIIGNVIYCAAGSDGSDPTALTHAFWSLDLSQEMAAREWNELPPWPGPARHKAVAAAQSGGGSQRYFYLFSGEIPERDTAGEIQYDYRRDAYRYDPSANEWTQLSDLSQPVAAASALAIGQSQVLVFSGSTGAHVKDPDPRPEFPRVVSSYHTITDRWTQAGGMPQAVVTTGAVHWNGQMVLATGEVSPGVRTPAVRSVALAPTESGFGTINTIVLALYLLALVGIGIRFSRGGTSAEDFFLAGKRIPWWAAGISIFATQLSAITFVSTPAVAYATNWLVLPGKVMILLMAPIVVAVFLPFFCRLNITSAYEYLERRFNLAVRLFGSASFILFQLMRMAIVVFLPALALSTITGIDVYACILIMGVLSTLYTVIGGMEAVIWTDVLQTVVLIGGMLIAIFIVAGEVGGLGKVLE
ncbi:MAG: SSS family solute:Na+ symporter, partial [Planctomycetota bacterium]